MPLYPFKMLRARERAPATCSSIVFCLGLTFGVPQGVKSVSHFNYINLKASLVIKIISFNEIKKMAHVVMLVIFYVNVITCQFFNLSHIYWIFVEKNHFLD
jgi:hypothetical protein